MAAGVDHGERIKLAFGNFNHVSSRGEKVVDELPMRASRVPRKRNRSQTSTKAAERARHSSSQLQKFAPVFPKLSQGNTCGQTHSERRGLTNFWRCLYTG